MVLRVEGYSPETMDWFHVADIEPGTVSSLSDNKDDGTRDIIVFKCAEDDSLSTISRAPFGVDVEHRNQRILLHSEDELETLKELKAGEECTLDIRAGASYEKMTIRFSHI